ncbi:hexokinase-domain-containing protein [Hysterangium stoloniferum]|nr:hexokinase-domain-containing protein [Hysterangium stoloniferum]
MAPRTPAAQSALDKIGEQFALPEQTLRAITEQFVVDFNVGLSQYNEAMAMIPTFVTGPPPDGSEKGVFLALDLGGTNLRICEVQLHGDKTFTLRQEKYKLSDSLKTGDATALFDYLADCVDAFLTDNSEQSPGEDNLSLGLTFSFPVEQTALDKGKILTWTKGFAVRNAIGCDVVQLLQDAFDRKSLRVRCVALVNDTVGALLSRSYTSGGCLLGAIFGTGTNGAYVENVAKITKLGNSAAAAAGGRMVVNTEWGGFDNARRILPLTSFDNKLDRESINPRYQAFEKLISGMYLGEITRNVLLSLIDATPPLLFNGFSTPQLNSHYGFDTEIMTHVAHAKTPAGIRKILTESFGLDPNVISDADTDIVSWACRIVATRAAKLSGTAVAAVLVQTELAQIGGGFSNGSEEIKIGVDGSLIQHYPHFEEDVRESLRAVVGKDVENRVAIGLAKDGSGVGAALCALQATR